MVNDMDIVMVGRVGEDGILEIVKSHEAEISGQYPKRYVSEGILGLEAQFGDDNCVRIMNDAGADVFVTGRQGIYGALYRMGEALGTGLKVKLEAIPVRQFCIEMADRYGVSPYLISSLGCILAVCEDGMRLADQLESNGYQACVIGYTTQDNDRCVINGETVTYLSPRDSIGE